MAHEAVKRIIIDLIPESKPFFEVMPEYDGERQTVILDPGLVQKAFWEIILTTKDNKFDTGNWNKGSFDTAIESLNYHYYKHGAEVGATSCSHYLRKAEEFAKTAKKGSIKQEVIGNVEGTIRYKKMESILILHQTIQLCHLENNRNIY